MTKQRMLMVSISAMVVWGAGCSSIAVNSDYDLGHDFSTLRTCKWFEGPSMPVDPLDSDPFTRNRFVNAVNTVLQEKGFRLVQEGEADFAVAIHSAIKERVGITQSARGGYRYRGVGVAVHDVDVRYEQEGTLSIDIIDLNRKQVVWRGWGTKTLGPKKDPETSEAQSLDAVTRILKSFPPQ